MILTHELGAFDARGRIGGEPGRWHPLQQEEGAAAPCRILARLDRSDAKAGSRLEDPVLREHEQEGDHENHEARVLNKTPEV